MRSINPFEIWLSLYAIPNRVTPSPIASPSSEVAND
jgi:hypothetical protein